MNPTADSIRADLIADVTLAASTTPRSLQVETGASQLFGCVAEGIYRLRGVEPAARVSWAAEVGSAIHARLAEHRTRVRPGVIVETSFTFKGVPATVDYLDPDQAILLDYKTVDSPGDVRSHVKDGVEQEWWAQLHLGACAAQEAGYRVEQVAIVLLPRSGDLDDAAVLGPWEVDETVALEAAAWAGDLDTAAADAGVDPREHRGQPAWWCRAFCGFASVCRGEEELPELGELAPVAAEFFAATQARDEGEATRARLRPLLLGARGRAGDYQVTTSGGNEKPAQETDQVELEAWWRLSQPGRPLPVRSWVKRTSVSLRVTKPQP